MSRQNSFRLPVTLLLCASLAIAAPLMAAPASTLPETDAASALQRSFIAAAARVHPSVVTIFTEAPPKTPPPAPDKNPDGSDKKVPDPAPFDDDSPDSSLGTGIIVRSDGYVLTNYHVVRSGGLIRVWLNADTEDMEKPVARLVGFDEESDIAVLKIDRQGLQPVEFADSDALQIGQWALALGAPFDQPQTLTAGILSAFGRQLDRPNSLGIQDFIQTDAAINPGNSGGPLIDLQGRVIGINTAILSPSRYYVGLGFSVPSNDVKRLLPILMSGQSVRRGFLGIRYVRLDKSVAQAWGVQGGMQIGAFAQLDGKPLGPAQAAGLQEDDIITAVNGQSVQTTSAFRHYIAAQPPGATVQLSVARPVDDHLQNMEVKVVLGDRRGEIKPAATPIAAQSTPGNWGLEVENLEKVAVPDRLNWGYKESVAPGAVVTKITPGSPADEADLQTGLRIVRARLDGQWLTIDERADWEKLSTQLSPGSRLLLQLRDSSNISVYKVLSVPASVEAPPTLPIL